MMEQHIAAYREEAIELLTELESSLLELEDTPDDHDLISRVFRAMHTIKGSGAMFGFDAIAAFTHEVETVFDLVRNGKMKVTQELLNLTLQSRDHISALLDASSGLGEADSSEGEAIIAGLRILARPEGDAKSQTALPAPTVEAAKPQEAGLQTWRIRFEPNRELLLCGSNPLSLLNELRDLGTCQITAQFNNVPTLESLVAEHCYLSWDMVLSTSRGESAIRDVFIFVEDDCRITVKLIDDAGKADDDVRKLGEILIDRGDLSADLLQTVLQQQRPLGELLVASGAVTQEKVESALVEQQHVKTTRQERTAAPEAAASIRVPAERLDQLVNLVGEMVTVQARLTQVANKMGEAGFVAIAEEVERLTNELRDTALNIRMLPIGSTFSKFKRLVRDLSMELGKEIEMETFGAETEIDKTVIEKLNDPLVHIIRNSIDHGIEKPDKRVAAGKPRTGTIRMGAEHAGDSVLITIYDDGGGINRDTIHKKAIELGMVSPTAELTDQEVYSYIFAPGFSLAAKVTSVSGRGVGMDVVKRGIEGLRGTIVVDSELGVGTTITLKIPLTLAIIESLLVKIGDSHFVLPLAAIEECVELSRQDIVTSHGRNVANVRGHLTPYICLREQFGVPGERPEIEQIVIVAVHGTRIGFVVDFVVGEHQTVIKPLGVLYQDIKGISGATILGDGSVALILSPGDLAKMAETSEHEHYI